MVFRFINFKVYQDAKKFHHSVVLFTKDFPREFLYLKDQVRRSSLSIVLQIAEGSAKRSDKDFNRYIEISLGSANETMAGLEISLLEKLINSGDFVKLQHECEEIVKQLGGFSKKLLVGG